MRSEKGLMLASMAIAGLVGAATRNEQRETNGTVLYQPGRSVATAIPTNTGSGGGAERARRREAAQAAWQRDYYAKLDGAS